jgi:hypothetical protein
VSGLPAPSPDLAARGLAEVGFEDRLVIYDLRRRPGPMPITAYSLAEALGALARPDCVPEYNRLALWIGRALGDHELSRAVAEAGNSEGAEDDKRRAVIDLLVRRLKQYREIARRPI